MQQRARRSAAAAGGVEHAAAPHEAESGLRGRRRRANFGERIEATCTLVGYTAEDAANIDASRAWIAAQIGAVTDEIYQEFLAQPETAAHFRDASGGIDRGSLAMRRAAFEGWLRSVTGDPLDVETAEYLASVGHAHARRERGATRIKARYLVSTIGSVQAAFTRILAAAVDDPSELAGYVAAWNKRLMIHLDMLLAVYGATESSAHWY